MAGRFQRLCDLLQRDLWHERAIKSRGKGILLQASRVVFLAARNFRLDGCFMRATSLAYVTLLSLVPLLALAFSVLKGFNVGETVLKPWLVRQVVGSSAPEDGEGSGTRSPEAEAVAGQKQLVEALLASIERTDVRALGTIGLVLLLWTTVKLLSTIEETFNRIWGVTRSRAFLRKVADYVSVVVIAPILLVVAMSLTTAFQSGALVRQLRESAVLGPVTELLLGWLRYVGTWIAFSAVYLLMPNTRVRLRAGILGGIVAGTAWQVAFWGYTYFQIGVGNYGAIYTTFAAVPVFLVWLYVSWVIVLFGAELSHAVVTVGHYWEERKAEGASFAVLETVGLRAMLAVSASFHQDGRPLTAGEIAERAQAPSRLVERALQVLAAAGLCTEIARDNAASGYQPGRTLEKITPADVLAALRSHGRPIELAADNPAAALAHELLSRADGVEGTDLTKATFRELAARLTAAGKCDARES